MVWEPSVGFDREADGYRDSDVGGGAGDADGLANVGDGQRDGSVGSGRAEDAS